MFSRYSTKQCFIYFCIGSIGSLLVPPQEPRIFDAQGKEISHVGGPFREGFELFLCCQVKGGE